MSRTVWSMVGRWLIYVTDDEGREHQLSLPGHMIVESHKLGLVDEMYATLERIAQPLNCACKPCHGDCRSQLALQCELEERQDAARAIISAIEDWTP